MKEGEPRPWGGIVQEATLEHSDRRESRCNLVYVGDMKCQPRRIYPGKGEVHCFHHAGGLWDEINNKKAKTDEVISARLEELQQLHLHDVYEEMPIDQ